MRTTFFPNSGSADATRATTTTAVIKPEAAAEPEIEQFFPHKNVWQSSYVGTCFESSYVTPRP